MRKSVFLILYTLKFEIAGSCCEMEGSRGRGRPKLAWDIMMDNLCRGLGLGLEDYYDKVKLRGMVRL